jgi:hypothetical protein
MSYNWEQDIDRAEQRAKAEKRALFVYYKYWLNNDSNVFISDVLNKPEVGKQFQNTVNCILDQDFQKNRQYMAKHGVNQVPGYLIKLPDGTHQEKTGILSKDAFLAWVDAAMKGTADRTVKPPPITPQKAP